VAGKETLHQHDHRDGMQQNGGGRVTSSQTPRDAIAEPYRLAKTGLFLKQAATEMWE
jgi:hypothetical protein